MKTRSRQLWVAAAAAAAVATTGPALAHDGHGLLGNHWHASDAWGFIALAIVVVVALYLSRSGKP